MDVDFNIDELSFLTEPTSGTISYNQLQSATPSTPNSSASSPPNDDCVLASPNFLHNVLNSCNGSESLVNSVSLDVKNSRRGPGRPRKDIPMVLFKGVYKTTPKRKKGGGGPLGGLNDRNGSQVIQSASENSNIGFPDDKISINSDELPYFPEKFPEKVCFLCNLGERSGLGQGDFMRLDTNSNNGSDVLRNALPQDIKDTRVESMFKVDECTQIPNTPSREKSEKNEYIYELDRVGHAEPPILQALLDGSYLYVHRMCAMWSIGTNVNTEADILNRIISVAEKCLTNKCTFCGMYGASIICRMKCPKSFHLPCATASGCFLVMENCIAFCRDHLDQVPYLSNNSNIDCRQCSTLGDISKLIICCTCGEHYHTTCIGLTNLPDTKSGWNCSQCIKCQICKQSDSSETRSVKCEQCQKLYHSTCLRPIISSVPKYGWKCIRCRICSDCGARSPGAGASSRWHCHYTICDSCYQQRNKGFSCPICHKAYRAAAHKEMVKCSSCNRFVHSSCDSEADIYIYHKKKEKNPDYDYTCPFCKITAQNENQHHIRNHTQTLMDPSLTSTTPYAITDSIQKDDNSELIDGMSAEQFFMDDKIADSNKIYKRRSSLKDLQRNRCKVMLPRTGSFMSYGRKRHARGKNRQLLVVNNPGTGTIDRSTNRSDDDVSIEKKILLCSAKDKFILSHDICIMCGSIGIDQEGYLIACVQCGQCFHPYCVNVKLSKIILQKGWRCLDCTICEGCGQKNDESRLILCDECDISYHIYCMDPPLDTVPHGSWKCKWCAICQKCGRDSPGKNSSWRNGFLECGPCASQKICCVCNQQYNDKDLIIQCRNCERWLHSYCDNITNEDEAQFCGTIDYQCVLCRSKDKSTQNKSISKDLALLKFNSTPFSGTGKPPLNTNRTHGLENESTETLETLHWVDGVCVNDRGLSVIKSLMTEIKRKRKLRPIKDTHVMDSGIAAAIESVVAGFASDNMSRATNSESLSGNQKVIENYKDGMVWMGTENNPPEGFSIYTNDEGVNILRKKRKRNLQKLGVGGFSVRNRTLKKDNDERILLSGTNNSNVNLEKKNKKLVKKKCKTKLSEVYPTYLQEAFFGKPLLDTKQPTILPYDSDTSEDIGAENIIWPSHKIENNTSEKLKITKKASNLNKPDTSSLRVESLQKIANNNPNSSSSIMEGKITENISKISSVKETSHTMLNNVLMDSMKFCETQPIDKKDMSTVMSPTAAIALPITMNRLEKTNNITEVRPTNTADLRPTNINCVQQLTTIGNESPAGSIKHSNIVPVPKLLQLHNVGHHDHGAILANQQKSHHIPTYLQNDFLMQTQPGHLHSSQSKGNFISNITPMHTEDMCKLTGQLDDTSKMCSSSTAPEEIGAAGTQKTAEKMRRDEDLGAMATISAVLYANTQHPELKQMYPNWNERCKQILKRWRSLSTESKAPFLQHAKDNRSALRMRRTQQDQQKIDLQQKTLKHHEQEMIWRQHQNKTKSENAIVISNNGKPLRKEYVCSINTLPERPAFNSIALAGAEYSNAPHVIKIKRNDHEIASSNLLVQKCVNPEVITTTETAQLRNLLEKSDLITPWITDAPSAQTTVQNTTIHHDSVMKMNTLQIPQKTTLVNTNQIDTYPTTGIGETVAIPHNYLEAEKKIANENMNRNNFRERYNLKIPEQPDAVVAPNSELEKLDQDENAGFGDILGGFGEGDDDDLLKSLTAEIGDDFNILEYADPELDELASNQNLLSKLEFDDTDKNI